MKYLGIDYGSKRVGFAESDESGSFAFPMMISYNDKSLIKDTLEIIRALNFKAIVMGESLDGKGKENKIAAEAREFAKEISSLSGVEVVFEKEWFTTVEARRQPGAKSEVDDAAAALILQRYLDKVNPKYSEDEDGDEDEEL